MEEDRKKRCAFCFKYIDLQRLEMHELGCKRQQMLNQDYQHFQTEQPQQCQVPHQNQSFRRDSEQRQRQFSSSEDEFLCPNCGETVNILETEQHLKSCISQCQYCQEVFPLWLMDQHLTVCNGMNNQEEIRQEIPVRQQRTRGMRNRNIFEPNQNQGSVADNPFPNGFPFQNGNPFQNGFPFQNGSLFQNEQNGNPFPNRFPFRNGNPFPQNSNFSSSSNQVIINGISIPQNQGSTQTTTVTRNGQTVTTIIRDGNSVSMTTVHNDNPQPQPDPQIFQYIFQPIFNQMPSSDHSNNGGISKQQSGNLIVTEYKDNKNLAEEHRRCTICMTDFQNKEKIKILDCIHRYHVECIDQWLQKNSTCPICKKDMRQFL